MVKVVQITDIHLFGDEGGCMAEWPGRPTFASLCLVLDDIQRRVPDLDALVVSGDIADLGLDDDGAYLALRRELERRGGGLLARTHVIPGNHDRRDPLLAAFPECMSDVARAGEGERLGDPDVSFAVTVTSGGKEWRLVGLDSGGRSFLLPGETRAAPTLSPAQLQRLEDELNDGQHRGKHTLLFMHHAPVAVGHFFDRPFTDAVRQSLVAMLRGSGRVQAIFTGHVHYECQSEIAGVPIWSSVPYTDTPPCLRILDTHSLCTYGIAYREVCVYIYTAVYVLPVCDQPCCQRCLDGRVDCARSQPPCRRRPSGAYSWPRVGSRRVPDHRIGQLRSCEDEVRVGAGGSGCGRYCRACVSVSIAEPTYSGAERLHRSLAGRYSLPSDNMITADDCDRKYRS